MKSDHYHFIVVGAGAAGLSLLIHMIQSGRFGDQKILLIDKAPKTENDRTWCFWEAQAGLFESIVYRQWERLWFNSDDNISNVHEIHPYRYKMIRGIDFYEYCFAKINEQKNISIEYGTVENLKSEAESASLMINGKLITADYIFSSINPDLSFHQNGHHFLWQHFKGWSIKASLPVFNPAEATLMDFRVDQHSDTRFVYVMPFSDTEALVEYTIFSKSTLSAEEYDSGLADYCQHILKLGRDQYTIASSEFGMIPMTDIRFPQSNGKIVFIGTAGGQTKASSGYTFRNIQKHSAAIVHSLITSGEPTAPDVSKKFRFYDGVLLQILCEKELPGATIFSKLFNNNPMVSVLKFLDNETSVAEEIKLISVLPRSRFIKAAISQLLR